MFQKKFVGCISLSRFRVAAATLPILLVFSPIHDKYTTLNPHVMIAVSDELTLRAAVFGFYAFNTGPGKIGAIGGLVLFSSLSCFPSQQLPVSKGIALKSYKLW